MDLFRVEALGVCAELWRLLGPACNLFDPWDIRMCFHEGFGRRPTFIVAEEGGQVVGLLPLSWIEELDCYAFFPGETWHGKTWLERNRFLCRDSEVLHRMIEFLDGPVLMRYIQEQEIPPGADYVREDEIGYLFHTARYRYSFAEYRASIPRKRFKGIERDVARLRSRDVAFRLDMSDDVNVLLRMNLEAFGAESYFYDPRFADSFDRFVCYLRGQGMLRITTVLIDGQVAAVDTGCVFKNKYTVFAGGVSPDFPGAAKLINLHHLERSCNERFEWTDFLCGDFNWKQRFRLEGRPLYLITTPVGASLASTP